MRSASGRAAVIVISHVPPWPASAGNEYRLARLIHWLEATGHDVHFVYRPFRPTPIDQRELGDLAERFPRLYVVDDSGMNIRFVTDIVEADDAVVALAGRPVTDHEGALASDSRLEERVFDLTRTFAPDGLIDLVAAIADAVAPVAIIPMYIFMSRILPFMPTGALRMIDLVDVFSTKADKVERFGVSDSFAVSRHDEAYLMERADVVIAIQEEEAEIVRALVPETRVITVGIDYPILPPSPRPTDHRVLIVGSENPMNVVGLANFLRYAWPTVRSEVPDAELCVVGSVGKSLSGAESGVSVLGRVDDIDAAYASANVAINPAIAGTGVKVKTLEAIAHRRPIVIWPSGADGLPREVRTATTVATNWASFAKHVIGHLTSGEAAADEQGGPDLASFLSADFAYRELEEALNTAASHLDGGH